MFSVLNGPLKSTTSLITPNLLVFFCFWELGSSTSKLKVYFSLNSYNFTQKPKITFLTPLKALISILDLLEALSFTVSILIVVSTIWTMLLKRWPIPPSTIFLLTFPFLLWHFLHYFTWTLIFYTIIFHSKYNLKYETHTIQSTQKNPFLLNIVETSHDPSYWASLSLPSPICWSIFLLFLQSARMEFDDQML